VLAHLGRPLPSTYSLTLGSDESWAWVAALIEGEGYIGPAPTTKRQYPRLSIRSTDFDVIARLFTLTGVGAISNIAPRRAGHRPAQQWDVSGRSDVEMVLMRTLLHFGTRRAERTRYVLNLSGR
jgi:hypothetical protein